MKTDYVQHLVILASNYCTEIVNDTSGDTAPYSSTFSQGRRENMELHINNLHIISQRGDARKF